MLGLYYLHTGVGISAKTLRKATLNIKGHRIAIDLHPAKTVAEITKRAKALKKLGDSMKKHPSI
jgi:hypothetical protein